MQALFGGAESRSMRIATMRRWAAALALLLAPAAARAQFPDNVPDTFRLHLGGMYAWFGTEVTFEEAITGQPIGGQVSTEDLLGLKSSTAGFAARGAWNFAGRLFLDFGYTGFSRGGRTVDLGQEFTFGGVTFTAEAATTTSVKSHLPYVDFRYGFIKNESVQLGASIGAAYPILQAKVSSDVGIIGPGGPIFGQTVSRTAKIEVPVPLLGLQFDGRLGDGLSAGVIFNGIFAPVHPYTGSIFDAEAHLDWFAARNFGVGVAFDYTRFKIKREDELSTVDFSYHYYGPRLYAILTF